MDIRNHASPFEGGVGFRETGTVQKLKIKNNFLSDRATAYLRSLGPAR